MRRYFWIAFFYVAWITTHYVATHLYIQYCTPASWTGFLMSPLIASMPHCEGLRWVISTGGFNITVMWTFAGAWMARHAL